MVFRDLARILSGGGKYAEAGEELSTKGKA
jgi:hypothetical protein